MVVAAVDRGNYPVVTFEDSEGASREWFPPIVAAKEGRRVYGWKGWALQSEPGWAFVRSIKRLLEDAGPYSTIELGGESVPILQLLTEMVTALRTALLEESSLPGKAGERFEILLGVPANANSNQRFLTLEPFQRAGFEVLGLLNEPSAASIEYGHRNRGGGRLERVLVYDLGGGTFDASLVRIADRMHVVVASEGVPDLGGDDFDIALAELALEKAGIDPETLDAAETFRLHEECRTKKEGLHPNSRRVTVDLSVVREGLEMVTIAAADYYERCRPMVERSIAATERLLAENEDGGRVDVLYVTGGGSELPLVARMLREVFGRRVKRSAYTRSATAIGLAIQADAQSGYVLRDKFHRNFGVWRESEGGRVAVFDPLFPKGTPLPGPGEAPPSIERRYSPVHNIGHFRYLECSHMDETGRPAGDIAVWDEVRFPFDPALQEAGGLESAAVTRAPGVEGQQVEERYVLTPAGAVEVRISNLTSGYSRTYRLGRWASKAEAVPVVKRRRARSEAG